MNSKETVVRLEANLVSRWPTVFTPCSVSVLPGLDTLTEERQEDL